MDHTSLFLKRSALFLCLLSVISFSQAGKLGDLEKEASKPKKSGSSSSSSSSSKSSSGSALGDKLAEGVAELILRVTFKIAETGITVLAKGGESSMNRYAQSHPVIIRDEKGERESGLFRKQGDPILPTLKLSSQWLDSSDNISAQLNRIEGGYGLIGFSYSENTLKEGSEELTLSNTLLHYRMSLGNNISWDLAYGRGRMNGNQSNEGDVFAMPIRIRFIKSDWHFEYYPVWSSYNGGSLSEHQFSMNYQYKYVGLSAGYKKWSAGLTTVDGIFGGLYLAF